MNVVGVMARDHPAGVSLADLARVTDLPKGTLHRLLGALTEAGYVERDARAGSYRLGLQAQVLGDLAGRRPDPVQTASADSLIRLAELSEDTTFLTMRQGSYGICVRREEGRGPIRNNAMGVGDRHPLGVGAGSLAILAALEDDEITMILDRNADVLERHYPLMTAETLQGIARRSREDGYALNEGLAAPGSWAIGVAVQDTHGCPVAAVSIASIEARLVGRRRDELVEALHREGRFIETTILRRTIDEDPIRTAHP